MSIQGIVFDVDGVLFDTEQLSRQIWETVSTEFGYPQVGQRYLEFVGNNRTDTFEKLERYFGPDFPKESFLSFSLLSRNRAIFLSLSTDLSKFSFMNFIQYTLAFIGKHCSALSICFFLCLKCARVYFSIISDISPLSVF